jgi:gamma-glutamyl hercynylcysteine S-oxide synthase
VQGPFSLAVSRAGVGPNSVPGRQPLLARWHAGRLHTKKLFEDVLTPDAYTERPISLRHPFVFYHGHIPAFAVNTLLRKALGRPAIDPVFERLFERGIDPESEETIAGPTNAQAWPSRDRVQAYVRRADAAVEDALRNARLVDDSDALLERGHTVFTILEHEEMHQETLLYMLHRLPYAKKRRPVDAPPLETGAAPPRRETVRVPAGRTRLGADAGETPFAWDNELPGCTVDVPAFTIDAHSVTNADFLEFVEAGGYEDENLWRSEDGEWKRRLGLKHPVFWRRAGGTWVWRGQFEEVPLPPAWPVWVSHAEASAYARWKGKRLPSEVEYHRAAFGQPGDAERPFPWGDETPEPCHGNFGGRGSDPVPAGARPEGASAWGVHDLVGNGWEWTSTTFSGFPGFQPHASYPGYSADFFDGEHWVLKGASPGTARGLVRRAFRNWFQGRYPYVYAKFRCAGT